MAASKLSALTTGSGLSLSDLMLVTKSPGGTPSSVSAKLSRGFAVGTHYCGVRLSASSTIAVSVGDFAASSNVYLHPSPGFMPTVRLYDGTDWDLYSFTAGQSISLSGKGDSVQDLFLYPSGGSVASELVAWTDTSNRATALSTVDGILCKAGSPTRLYVGTLRTLSSTVSDTEQTRHLFSYYNRYPKKLYFGVTKASSAYTTGAWRYFDNNSSNCVEVITGWVEESVLMSIGSDMWGGAGYVAIGANTTSGQAPALRNLNASLVSAGVTIPLVPSVGLYKFFMVEYGAAGFNASSCYLQGLVWV